MADLVLPRARSTRAWIVYDLANTIFALGVIGRYFPAWMTDNGIADSRLALTEALAGFIVVFVAPWIGARSDALGRRVPILVATTLIAVAATGVLTSGPTWFTFLALGVALVAFNTGGVVYDALLPEVSTPVNRARVSGLGIGVGYVGSFIGLGIGVIVLEVLDAGYRITFITLAAAFLVFAVPAFLFVEERSRPSRPAPALRGIVKHLAASWRTAQTIPHMTRFLVSRFLYTDAINTLIGGFLAIYAETELDLSPTETTGLLVVAIAAAIPGAVLAGRLADRLGPKRILVGVLFMWLVALIVGIWAGTSGMSGLAWVLGPIGGAALGGTWASDRVLMNELSPDLILGEMYGLYATVGRFATIIGPLAWAFVVEVVDLGRPAALGALALFIVAALVVLRPVVDPRADVLSRPDT